MKKKSRDQRVFRRLRKRYGINQNVRVRNSALIFKSPSKAKKAFRDMKLLVKFSKTTPESYDGTKNITFLDEVGMWEPVTITINPETGSQWL